MTSARQAETQGSGVSRSNMPSSVIRSYRYDPQRRRLELEFVSGRRYRYHDVPEETWRGMPLAFSKGEFFNEKIRDHFRFTREA
jgi:hypothetical protein